ncbi:MAG: alpha/beta hydrolase [Verrucomicrobiota bacterium]|nr:alpha/beta hydrolase [Verrucomicrobiota bacterium]
MKKLFFWVVKFVLVPIGILLVATVLIIVLLRLYAQNKVAGQIRINTPNGIHSIEKIRLGGIDQWIQIRGEDRTKPILLCLHGGPGFPEMPFSHLNAALEKDFVVVQWDQRGAGKSYSWSIPGKSMQVEQFVSDTHDLVELLLRRFHRSKCYLVAHSWGTVFGTLAVARYPQLFKAYVAIGQVADFPESQQARYRFALASARREKNEKAIAELTRIGRPPYPSFTQSDLLEKWVSRFDTARYPDISPWRMAWWAFESPAYSWIDLVKIPLGARYSFRMLWREVFYKINLFKQAPRLEVPVYFFLGRYDEVVTAKVAEKYFDALDAPKGKQLIWFEKSGHWPHLNERQKYRDELVNRVLRETATGDQAKSSVSLHD